MKRLQQYIEIIKSSNLPEEVKKELLEEIQQTKPDKFKIALIMLHAYEVGKDIYKLIEEKLNE